MEEYAQKPMGGGKANWQAALRTLGKRDRRELSRLLMVELEAEIDADIAGWKQVREAWRSQYDVLYPN